MPRELSLPPELYGNSTEAIDSHYLAQMREQDVTPDPVVAAAGGSLVSRGAKKPSTAASPKA